MNYCPFCMSEINGEEICPVCKRSSSFELPAYHLVPGSILNGKYIVGAAIGEGGFGITYIGRDKYLDIRVAIKEYYPNGYVNRASTVSAKVTCSTESERRDFFEKGRERFLNEARILAKFNGEAGIVEVRDFFEENNTAYIVMEYLDGMTLKKYLKLNGVIPPKEAVSLMMPVMLSLKKVHERGLIHRDISPDNIMMVGGKIKLLDFGAARNMSSAGNKSLSVMLKPGYAPEEQYRSKGEQGPWTDVYALCATLYKCITGATPEDSTQRMYKDELISPSARGIAIDPVTDHAIMKGLAVLANDRYQNIDELINGLNGNEQFNQAVTDDGATVYAGSPANAAPRQSAGQARQSAPGHQSAPDQYGSAPQTPKAQNVTGNPYVTGGNQVTGSTGQPYQRPTVSTGYPASQQYPPQYQSGNSSADQISYPPVRQSAPEKKKSKLPLILLTAVILIGLGIGIFFLVNANRSADSGNGNSGGSIIGEWTADIDVTEVFLEQVEESIDSEYKMDIDTSDISPIYMTMNMSFEEDKDAVISLDKQKYMNSIRTFMIEYFDLYLDEFADEYDMTKSELLEEMGYDDLEDFIDDLIESQDLDGALGDLEVTGKYKFEDGKLFMADNEQFNDDDYFSVELSGNKLKLIEANGAYKEDDDYIAFIDYLPLTFKRK